MQLKKFVNTIKGIQLENLGHRYTNIALSCAVIALSVAIFSKTNVVTVVPPTLVEKAWIDSNNASAEYTEAWALYIAQTLGNVTPGTSSMIRKAIEPLLEPAVYQDVVNAIEKQVQDFRRDRVVLSFEPKRVLQEKVNPNVYFVSGRSTMEGPTGDKTAQDITYEIRLNIKNYKPTIASVSSYKGGPRTTDVIDRQERMEDKQREAAQRKSQQ